MGLHKEQLIRSGRKNTLLSSIISAVLFFLWASHMIKTLMPERRSIPVRLLNTEYEKEAIVMGHLSGAAGEYRFSPSISKWETPVEFHGFSHLLTDCQPHKWKYNVLPP